MSDNMAPSDIRKHKKRPHVKARTGCETCKIRRVKCDETKPFCVRCTSTGRKCDGYALTVNKKSRNIQPELHQSSAGSFYKVAARPAVSPAIPFFASEEEARALQFFLEKTTPWTTQQVPANYCGEFALPYYHTSDTVKHLVLSMSAVHQSIARPSQNTASHRVFLWSHHVKALRHLLEQPQTAANTGMLTMSCILLAAFEDIIGRGISGQKHFIGAFRMVQTYETGQLGPRNKNTDEILSKFFWPIVGIMERTKSIFEESGAFEISEEFATDQAASAWRSLELVLPGAIKSVQEQRDLLVKVLDQINRFADSQTIQQYEVLQLKELQKVVTRIGYMMDEFIRERMDSVSPGTWFENAMLRSNLYTMANGYALLVMTHTVGQPDEAASDVFISSLTFLHLLHRAQLMVEGYLETNEARHGLHSTSLEEYNDFGLIPLLFFIGYRCRRPVERKSAIKLLYALHRAEGIWNSDIAGKIAETIMQIEQRRCCGSISRCNHLIPVEKRIRAVAAEYLPESRRTILSYICHPYTSDAILYKEAVQDYDYEAARNITGTVSFPLTKIFRLSGYQGLVTGRPIPITRP